MENNKKHPIIANGQSYIEPLKKKYNGHQPTLPHEYEEAKARVYAIRFTSFKPCKEIFF